MDWTIVAHTVSIEIGLAAGYALCTVRQWLLEGRVMYEGFGSVLRKQRA